MEFLILKTYALNPLNLYKQELVGLTNPTNNNKKLKNAGTALKIVLMNDF